MNAVEFGKYLKSLRKERRMTLKNINEFSGVSHSYLSQIENGLRSVPSADVLIRISKALGIDYKEFLSIVLGGEFDADTADILSTHVQRAISKPVLQKILSELTDMSGKINAMKNSIESLLEESEELK